MRVLVLSADYAPGSWSGIGTAVAVQAAALARQGVGVEVLVPPDHPAPAEGADARSPRVRRLSERRFVAPREPVDVVHVHSLALLELALELRRRLGTPLVYTAHASVESELGPWARHSGWSAVQEVALAESDHVLFPSAAERDAALRRRPALARTSSVLPNGVPARRPSPVAAVRDGPVVFAGRFAASKGLLLLGRVVRLLAIRPAIRFVLAGGHGDPAGAAAVARLVRRFPDRCRAVGWLAPDALERLFGRASIVVVPSRYEPFGLVALEAMRAGAPVLASATGGLREVVAPGSGGLLVDSRRPEAWSAAIVGLWDSPRLREELARRGPRHVAEHYDPDALAGSLARDVYAPLAARTARRVA